jgi:hypothetical protein
VKLSRHVADKGHPFASQVLAPSGQLEPNGTIFGLLATVGTYLTFLRVRQKKVAKCPLWVTTI